MKQNLEKITLRTYELVKDINQKIDYLIETQKGDFYRNGRYSEP